MAKLLGYIPEYKESQTPSLLVEAVLILWKQSRERHPYIFYMGNDFRKLKAPTLWYDILSVVEGISLYPQAQEDPRFREMLAIIENKRDANGFYTSESVYQKLKDWDFSQKKVRRPI